MSCFEFLNSWFLGFLAPNPPSSTRKEPTFRSKEWRNEFWGWAGPRGGRPIHHFLRRRGSAVGDIGARWSVTSCQPRPKPAYKFRAFFLVCMRGVCPDFAGHSRDAVCFLFCFSDLFFSPPPFLHLRSVFLRLVIIYPPFLQLFQSFLKQWPSQGVPRAPLPRPGQSAARGMSTPSCFPNLAGQATSAHLAHSPTPGIAQKLINYSRTGILDRVDNN
jgi:hypothetical protein